MRQLVAAMALIPSLLLLTACGGAGSGDSNPSTGAHSEPRTTKALLRIAGRFNDDYSANRVGAVYDRWDARSRAVISRADYIRRHKECQTNPGPATVEGTTREAGWWLVRYSISDTSLTDYWRYQQGRWVFDLIRSNPDAVRLYRLKPAKYLAALGCHP